MLEFLLPLWWAALPVLIVPVAIHLWSRRERRPVLVGSVRFLEGTKHTQARSLKLTDVPLLLVRLALLAALVALLARPHWQTGRPAMPDPPARWLLVHPELATSPDAAVVRRTFQAMDSLESAGFELRTLAPGFSAYEPDAPVTGVDDSGNIWSLLREADATLPPGSELVVAAPARRAFFGGARPVLATPVSWITPASGGRNRWIRTARRIEGDSLLLTLGYSDSLATFYQSYTAPLPAQPTILSENDLPAVELNAGEGFARLVEPDGFAADDRRPIGPSAEPVSAALYHDPGRQEDARYVRAALEAAARFVHVPLRLEVRALDDSARAPMPATLTFWLSGRALPEAFAGANPPVTVVRDAPAGEVKRLYSKVIAEDLHPVTTPTLRQRVAPVGDEVPLWMDGRGIPLLTRAQTNGGPRYSFYSRFHPGWTDLVLSEAWPRWMLTLLPDPEASGPSSDSDRRLLDAAQVSTRTAVARAFEPAPWSRSLYVPIWGMVVLLFSLERWMAFRTNA